VAIIDSADRDLVSGFNWQLHHGSGGHLYVASRTKEGTILLHRFLTRASSGMVVDHINNNGLDNRRINIRVCSYAQNLHNRDGWRRARVPFKGVTRAGNKYRARIMNNGVVYRLGVHETPEAAAMAYDEAAIQLHGSYAKLNFARDAHGLHLASNPTVNTSQHHAT
jgi:hypothetical protein